MSRIPTSGVLTWNDIQNSFGGSNPIGINEYYLNGGIVPTSGLNSGIPTSGQIDAGDFRGADGFSGTVGNYTAGTTGGKFATFGYRNDNLGAYGTDLGLAFTTGSGIKCQLNFLLFLLGANTFSFAGVNYQGVTSSNLNGKTLTSGGSAFTLANGTTQSIGGGPYAGLTSFQYNAPGLYSVAAGNNYTVTIS